MSKINSDNCTTRKIYNHFSRKRRLLFLALSCDSNVSNIYINDVILLLMKKEYRVIESEYILEKKIRIRV